MSRVTILGAGAMGSALATPLRARGQHVALWGTWLDDHFLHAYASGAAHPGTQVTIPDGVNIFYSDALEQALAGSDLVIVAIASEGVHEVSRRAAPYLRHGPKLALVSKGFYRQDDGAIALMPEAMRAGIGVPDAQIVVFGGPCKANEVAAGRVTATAFASRDGRTAEQVADLLRTDNYRPQAGDDELGLEVSAALKNVFAIALGVADGLETRTGEPWHNLKSAVFAKAVDEIATIARALGGRTETVFGLSGVGDLEVTGLSGRNKVYGSRLGAGEPPQEALTAMHEAGQTVEGVSACPLAVELVGQLDPGVGERLSLLYAIDRVLGGADPLTEISRTL